MNLNNPIWNNLEGGYRVPYNPTHLMDELQRIDNQERSKEIIDELWNELHHQGDVGAASYLSVPHLARIVKDKGQFDSNLISLCIVIEQQRVLGSNPELPQEFNNFYFEGLKELKQFVHQKLEKDLNYTDQIIALSTIATCNGKIKLGKAILKMEDEDILDEFLEQF